MIGDARASTLAVPVRLPPTLDEAHELIIQLRAALIGTAEAPPGWGLTRVEATIVGVLLERDVATREALMLVLYAHRDDPPQVKTLDAFVVHIRKKLQHFGVGIETVFGVGWRLTEEGKRSLRDAVRPEPHP